MSQRFSHEPLCLGCGHDLHPAGDCEVATGYDHLNGDHFCGCGWDEGRDPDADPPLLVQCAEKDSGGAQCEALIASLDDPHPHHISDATIEDYLYRPFHIHIDLRGGYGE